MEHTLYPAIFVESGSVDDVDDVVDDQVNHQL